MDEYDNRPDPRLQVSICEENGFYDLRIGENNYRYPALVLIFNQVDFQGNVEQRRLDEPGDDLRDLMQELGFKVYYFRNYTRIQIMNTVGKYATLRRRDRKEYASILVFFLSHGNIKFIDNDFHEIVKTADDDMLISDLWKNFESTETWNNKPKCFFFQTCRGEDLVEGVKVENRKVIIVKPNSMEVVSNAKRTQGVTQGVTQSQKDWNTQVVERQMEDTSLAMYEIDNNDNNYNDIQYRDDLFAVEVVQQSHSGVPFTSSIPFVEPKFSDLLIFHSTYQGATSIQESDYSPFINAVTKNFRRDMFNADLLSIVQNIQKELAYTFHATDTATRDADAFTSSELEGSKQMPIIESTLTGKIRYENPNNIQVAAAISPLEIPQQYDMKTGKGCAVIFANNYFSMGFIPPMQYVTADVKELVKSFDKLNCDVTVHWDLNKQEFVNALTDLGNQDYSERDFFCLVFYGYGFKDRLLLKKPKRNYLYDYGFVEVSELWQPFLGSRCPTLIDKPKFFIVSAIGINKPGVSGKFKRFVTKEVNIEKTRALNHEASCYEGDIPEMFVIPEAADFLLLFHTSSGTAHYMDFMDDYMEYDETDEQSIFMRTLNEELQNMRNFVGDRSLLDLIQRFQYKITRVIEENIRDTRESRNKREVPLIVSTLTKNFVLHLNQLSE